MSEAGIKRLLGEVLPDPLAGSGISRAELYLLVDAPNQFLDQALAVGAIPLSQVKPRDWGHVAGYCTDVAGHVGVFTKENGQA